MAEWVLTIRLDPDKTDIGTINATFTDDDHTVYTYDDGAGNRLRATITQINAYRDAAIAGRNAWQSRKATQTSYMNTAVARWQAAGETATAGIST